MCTAITYQSRDFYFGRNLDLDYSYEETVAVTPRNYPLRFLKLRELKRHYALIGMAYVVGGFPLYYEAVNEKGLCMAGLNFPGSGVYQELREGMDNVAPFEIIPWILGQCANRKEARTLLARMNVAALSFSSELPAQPLHWLISDPEGSLTVEPLRDGLKVYENPVGVLTNNPPFDFQMTNLIQYMGVSAQEPQNRFFEGLTLQPYCLGMGGIGLPGDLSSASRFVKAAFTKLNSVSGPSESESVSQFFHILNSVAQQRGCVRIGGGKPGMRYEITVYSCCCNASRGIYYYTTYENSRITGIDMHKEDLEGECVISYPLICGQQIYMQNEM